jgi:hypothetical protein
MTKEEFNKIIEVNPEAKFKLVSNKSCVVFFPTEAELTFVSYEDEEDLGIFSCEGAPYVQSVWFCDIEIIAESVTLKPKLKFPCCIATSEIKDEDTLKEVQKLFQENGAELEETSWRTLQNYDYYGVDYDKEVRFWNNKDSYSGTEDESEVTVYTLEDLFPETEEETVVDSAPWTEWCGEGDIPDLGSDFELKFRDGDIEICKDDIASTWRWEHCDDRDIVAYRKHVPKTSQEALSDVLTEQVYLRPTFLLSDVQASVEPFKVIKHSYYDVTIKGEEYRFTKEEANLLCNLLIETIGEDYEPI